MTLFRFGTGAIDPCAIAAVRDGNDSASVPDHEFVTLVFRGGGTLTVGGDTAQAVRDWVAGLPVASSFVAPSYAGNWAEDRGGEAQA